MRLKSHQQQQQQQQQQQWQQSTNQRLKTHVTIIINILVVAELCLLTTSEVAAAVSSSRYPATIQIGDPKQRIPRQVAEDDKTGDDCDCDSLDGSSYHKPHFTKGRSVIVELFEWKFVDVAEECRTFLGPKGYGGVQLSPVLEHTVIKTDKLKHPWWQRYETISYRFASRSGDESEFWSMSRICNDNGVRIYLDVLFNHMAAPLHLLLNETTENKDYNVNTLLESNVNIFNQSYPNVPYKFKHFHRPCAVGNSQSAHELRNCQLNGHPDLDLGLPSVQKHIVDMLNKFIDMGVAGFNVYGAKYVWPNDLKNIYNQLKNLSKDFNFANNSRPFMYHDVFDIGLDSISKTEYATYGAVTEYLYAAELSTILRGKAPLSSLINWGPAMGFLSHSDSVIFIDSPETQRGLPYELGKNRVITYRNPQKYAMANAMMMTHPYGGVKRIMSSYYYKEKNINQGPPAEEGDDDLIRSPELNEQQQCTVVSGWVCEHRWPMMVNLVELANYFSVGEHREESIIHFQTNGPNHIAFCRGHKAFVAMNNDAEKDFIKDVYTCLEPGVYCDVISGGLKDGAEECHGHRLEVNETGYVKLNLLVADDSDMLQELEKNEDGDVYQNVVENLGVLVVYVGSKIGSAVNKMWEESTHTTDSPIENQEELGEQDDNKDEEDGAKLPGDMVLIEMPANIEKNHVSEENVDSDPAADEIDIHISDDDNNEERESGEEDASHDATDENSEAPLKRNVNDEVEEIEQNEDGEKPVTELDINEDAILADTEVQEQETADKADEEMNNDENIKDDGETAADGDQATSIEDVAYDPVPSEGDNDEVAAEGEENKVEGEEVKDVIDDNENNSDIPDESQEKSDDVDVPEGEPTAPEAQDEVPEEEHESVQGNEVQSKEVENDKGPDADGDGEEVENLEKNEIEETEKDSETDQDSDTPEENQDLAAPRNDEEENDVPEVADLVKEVESLEESEKQVDEEPAASDTHQDSGIPDDGENHDEEESEVAEIVDLESNPENIDTPNEVASVADDKENNIIFSPLNEDSNSNKESKETNVDDNAKEEESEDAEGQTIVPEFSEINNEANDNNEKGEDDNGNGNDTNLQIDNPFSLQIAPVPGFVAITDAAGAESPLEKYNTTIYEVLSNITEPLPFAGNNSKAEVKNDEVMRGAMFPASRTQLSNGDQMLKSHSFLLWIIIVKMLTIDFDLKKLQFHLMLKPTPMV